MADDKAHTIEMPSAVSSVVEARTGDAVFVVGPDYRIVYWDSDAESLTGHLAEEVVGKRCYEVVLGEREGGDPGNGGPVGRGVASGFRTGQRERGPRGPLRRHGRQVGSAGRPLLDAWAKMRGPVTPLGEAYQSMIGRRKG